MAGMDPEPFLRHGLKYPDHNSPGDTPYPLAPMYQTSGSGSRGNSPTHRAEVEGHARVTCHLFMGVVALTVRHLAAPFQPGTVGQTPVTHMFGSNHRNRPCPTEWTRPGTESAASAVRLAGSMPQECQSMPESLKIPGNACSLFH